jgi:hypothetical protein
MCWCAPAHMRSQVGDRRAARARGSRTIRATRDAVRGAVHALHPGDLQPAEQALSPAQDGSAAEHRALELEAGTVFGGQVPGLPAGQSDRSLADGAHVLAGLRGPSHVGEGGLTVVEIGVRGLDDDVGRDLADHPLVTRVCAATGQAGEGQLARFGRRRRSQVDAVAVDSGTGSQSEPTWSNCHPESLVRRDSADRQSERASTPSRRPGAERAPAREVDPSPRHGSQNSRPTTFMGT